MFYMFSTELTRDVSISPSLKYIAIRSSFGLSSYILNISDDDQPIISTTTLSGIPALESAETK